MLQIIIKMLVENLESCPIIQDCYLQALMQILMQAKKSASWALLELNADNCICKTVNIEVRSPNRRNLFTNLLTFYNCKCITGSLLPSKRDTM
jgi:hypothetical protein